MSDNTNEHAGIAPASQSELDGASTAKEDDKVVFDEVIVTADDLDATFVKARVVDSAGLALIEQTHVIPTTGVRKVTTSWEYWTYCFFYFAPNGAPMALFGASQLQLLITLQFPDGNVKWGGTTLPMSSMLLDLTGIIFAIQLVSLLFLGAYADFGNWRPFLLIGFTALLYICQFAMCGLAAPGQWQGAQACYVLGTYAMNMVVAFYAATFPEIVQDLPKVITSEQEVLSGTKSAEAHDELVSYERSKLNNLLNVLGSCLEILASAIALGIAAAIGYNTDAQLLYQYRVLMGFLSAFTVLATVPFFIAQKHRPGQQLPEGVPLWKAGPQQVWSAAKSVRQLKQCLMYLVAYFLLQETYGTYYSVVGILQNEVVEYSPTMLNALNIVGSVCGGGGNLFVYLMQKRFRFSTKAGVFYGAFMTLLPNLWGAIGSHTQVIGFHHLWEFWLAEAWNFQMAAWASYQIAFLSEVSPAPKAYMFFSLFNTVGKTSGFIGPFISSAIIDRAGGNTNMAFWFLFAMGSTGQIVLWFVDAGQAKIDNAKYLEREAAELYTEEQRRAAAGNGVEMEAVRG
ncbi:putative autophagy protein [Naematelia encephala]|uniref:Autophagy-related protein n=1 Tax=Naematelia encephala TaxID=71784 RepID=A0A1Y2AZA5_9TREE|nr:putative autophagy protein [Naematelia encephala]